MAQTDIQKSFIDGIQEIYTTLFTDGVNDGVEYYYLDESSTKVDSVYRESKNKKYSPRPTLLVACVKLAPEMSEETFKDIEYSASFKVPLKCLLEHEIDLTPDGLKTLKKGKIAYGGKEYKISNIKPTTFIENVFLVYEFMCEEV